MVEFPHWPFGEVMRVPEGNGGVTVEDEVVLDVEDDGDEVGGTMALEGEEGEGVGVGVATGPSPQRPYCGWQPTSSPQYSNWVPHQLRHVRDRPHCLRREERAKRSLFTHRNYNTHYWDTGLLRLLLRIDLLLGDGEGVE